MRIKTTPTEGFILELAYIFGAVDSTVLLVKKDIGLEYISVCLICWLLALINLPQLSRFKNRETEKKFIQAFNILKNEEEEMVFRQTSLETIIDCANKGYEPAKKVIEQLQSGNQ